MSDLVDHLIIFNEWFINTNMFSSALQVHNIIWGFDLVKLYKPTIRHCNIYEMYWAIFDWFVVFHHKETGTYKHNVYGHTIHIFSLPINCLRMLMSGTPWVKHFIKLHIKSQSLYALSNSNNSNGILQTTILIKFCI